MPVMAQEDVAVPLANVGITQNPPAATAADADERFTVIGAAGVVTGVQTVTIPDLEERLLTGTTIALLAPAAMQLDGTTPISTVANAVQAKDVVISEIMWALNTNAANFTDQANMQWIELYNSTLTSSAKGAINTTPLNATMGNWFLYFVDEHDEIPTPEKLAVNVPAGATTTVADILNVVALDLDNTPGDEQYIVVDMVSNLAGGGWTVVTDAGTYGQSGKIKRETTDATAAVDLVSMYRKINYDNVEKDFEKDTAALNRTEQLKAIPGGGGSGGWAKSSRAFDNNLFGTPGKRHFKGAVTIVTASSVDRTKVIVNEIGHSSSGYRHRR